MSHVPMHTPCAHTPFCCLRHLNACTLQAVNLVMKVITMHIQEHQGENKSGQPKYLFSIMQDFIDIVCLILKVKTPLNLYTLSRHEFLSVRFQSKHYVSFAFFNLYVKPAIDLFNKKIIIFRSTPLSISEIFWVVYAVDVLTPGQIHPTDFTKMGWQSPCGYH